MTTQDLQVDDNMVVTLAYKLFLDDDTLIDSSDEYGPLEYLHGYNQIIPGLERAVSGLKKDDRIEVLIPPEDAYGARFEDSFESVPLDVFPDDIELEIGMELELIDSESNEELVAYIYDISDEAVLIDFNHPLAGEDLFFEIRVLDIRPATADELAHGHVHNEDEHKH